MDLQSSLAQECSACNSITMRYDIKSGLFKCFNTNCGFIQSLTCITYEDETQVYDDSNKTKNEQLNNKRYANDSEAKGFAQKFLKKLDQKEYQKGDLYKRKDNETSGEFIDLEDRIRNEVIACKRLIKKWSEFLDDKKILFEILEYFIEIVNLDPRCTVPSVKRKAASSFCFVLTKYIGPQVDLKLLAEETGVSLPDIIKEQEKVQQIKFAHTKQDSNLFFDNLQDDKMEWESICHEFLQKIIFQNLKEGEKKRGESCKRYHSSGKYWVKSKDIDLSILLNEKDFGAIRMFEQNIKQFNPSKKKYEKFKVSASIVFAFCLLTLIPELQIKSPLEIIVPLQISEKKVLKYYLQIILPNKEEIVPKQDIWPCRQQLSSLKMF